MSNFKELIEAWAEKRAYEYYYECNACMKPHAVNHYRNISSESNELLLKACEALEKLCGTEKDYSLDVVYEDEMSQEVLYGRQVLSEIREALESMK